MAMAAQQKIADGWVGSSRSRMVGHVADQAWRLESVFLLLEGKVVTCVASIGVGCDCVCVLCKEEGCDLCLCMYCEM